LLPKSAKCPLKTTFIKDEFLKLSKTFNQGIWDDEKARELFQQITINKEISNETASIKIELKELIELNELISRTEKLSNKIDAISSLTNGESRLAIPLLLSEMVNLIFEMKDFDVYGILSEKIESAQKDLEKIQNFQETISEAFKKKTTDLMKKYNYWAINEIDYSRTMSKRYKDEKGWGEKDQYRNKLVGLLKDLQEIDTNFLYEPVISLYSSVYHEIYTQLDPVEKLRIAKSCLQIEKREIEYFKD